MLQINVLQFKKIHEIPRCLDRYVSVPSLLNQKSQGPIIHGCSDTIHIEILVTFNHIFN